MPEITYTRPSDETTDEVALYPITQATTATFSDLYLRLAFLFFVDAGSKRVLTPTKDLIGEEGGAVVGECGSAVVCCHALATELQMVTLWIRKLGPTHPSNR